MWHSIHVTPCFVPCCPPSRGLSFLFLSTHVWLAPTAASALMLSLILLVPSSARRSSLWNGSPVRPAPTAAPALELLLTLAMPRHLQSPIQSCELPVQPPSTLVWLGPTAALGL